MATTNVFDMADTWNAGGTVFDAIKMDVTNTASAAGSDLLDLAIGGSSLFRVDKRSTVTIAGQSLTGSEALSVLDMAATWNTTGAPTGLKLDVTDTASDAASLLLDLQVGAASKFKVDKSGNSFALYYGFSGVAISHTSIYRNGGNLQFTVNSGQTHLLNSLGFVVGSGQGFNMSSTSSPYATVDVRLLRDSAATLALKNSTNAQTFNVYGTYTDASNYERGFLKWAGNIFYFGAESAGTGADRHVRVAAGIGMDVQVYAGTNNLATFSTTEAKLRKFVTYPDKGELTIATGAVTATGTYHTVDTEADAASDDLDTINGGSDGRMLIIQAEDGARSVVAKDGTGNLQLAGDFTMDNAQDTLTLLYSGALSAWVEISRSDNGA